MAEFIGVAVIIIIAVMALPCAIVVNLLIFYYNKR